VSAPGGFDVPIHVTCRPRFDECGPDGRVRTSTLLRYAQDAAWIHSERLDFDRSWYAQRGLAWVVRAATLAIVAPIELGAALTIATSITGVRRVWARRLAEMRTNDGSLVAWAHTDWVMTDARGMPGRVPPEFPAAMGTVPPSFEPGRVPLPLTPDDAHRHVTRVRPQDVDPMNHVNNGAYLDYLEEALLDAGPAGAAAIGRTPRTVRLEYLAPAAPLARLEGAVWPLADDDGAGWAWRLATVVAQPVELARGRLLVG
jgi:acyl-CoA thioesterase FadM